CECSSGFACNPVTRTCCDWKLQCASAKPCTRVCGGAIECRCPVGVCRQGSCCQPHHVTRCGESDGCGDYALGPCPGNSIVRFGDDGIPQCEPLTQFCHRLPSVCAETEGDPSRFCLDNPRRCSDDPDRGYKNNAERVKPSRQ